jgi:hypothetical protein
MPTIAGTATPARFVTATEKITAALLAASGTPTRAGVDEARARRAEEAVRPASSRRRLIGVTSPV